MKLIDFKYKVGDNYVVATFLGDIFKLPATESFELSFERIGGEYQPESSGIHGSVWIFPTCVNSELLETIIKSTCFECGGLMKNAKAFDDINTIIKIRKCTSCWHSHIP